MVEQTRTHEDVARFPIILSNGEVAGALVAIVRRLSTATSIAEITEIVTHTGRSLLNADGMTFVLREGDRCYYAEEDAISPLWKGHRFPMNTCISGWCMTERKPAVIPDVYADSRIPKDAYRPTFVRSMAMVPVRLEDPIAAIGAYWSKVRKVEPPEIELLQTVASCAALAIANVTLKNSERASQEAERRQSVLVRELSHRVKNSLTVVEAIARQSARHAQSLDSFSEAFTGRLRALSAAFDWLIDPGRDWPKIERVVATALAPFRTSGRSITAEGPDVAIRPQTGVSIALILHELATNALKYGALNSATGAVRIAWTYIEKGTEVPWIRITWQESGGPAVTAPSRQGFGTTMMERMARLSLRGNAEITFAPEGVRCTIEFPLRRERRSAHG